MFKFWIVLFLTTSLFNVFLLAPMLVLGDDDCVSVFTRHYNKSFVWGQNTFLGEVIGEEVIDIDAPIFPTYAAATSFFRRKPIGRYVGMMSKSSQVGTFVLDFFPPILSSIGILYAAPYNDTIAPMIIGSTGRYDGVFRKATLTPIFNFTNKLDQWEFCP